MRHLVRKCSRDAQTVSSRVLVQKQPAFDADPVTEVKQLENFEIEPRAMSLDAGRPGSSRARLR